MVQNLKLCFVICFSILFVVLMIYMNNWTPSVYDYISFDENSDMHTVSDELITSDFEIIESDFEISKSNLPWYFRIGTVRPLPSDRKDIWPEETLSEDRLLNQLMYVPVSVDSKVKTVYAGDVKNYPKVKNGDDHFLNCPVDKCVLVEDKRNADAVIHKWSVSDFRYPKVRQEQVWILYASENPLNSEISVFVNWTASYRSDSDIVQPYGKWIYYNESVKTRPQTKNYAKGKTKKVVWFVSNCSPHNGRDKYARELKKYIDVDIYGSCGDKKCPKSFGKNCLKMMAKQYKFYLSFENANCREYITEKFFRNALENDILPIVMGAPPDDYERVAPFNSYIHVDYFPSPKHLADYLHKLDKDDDLYNTYFQWKGTGEIMDSLYFFCRLCAMLHSNRPAKSYGNFMNWWKPAGMCLEGENQKW